MLRRQKLWRITFRLLSEGKVEKKPTLVESKAKVSRRERPVPASQFDRFATFGRVGVNVGASVLSRAVKQSIFGVDKEHKKRITILSTEEIKKIVELLCTVRGAAMKVGQVISLQDDSILDPQIRAAFEKVRDSADSMPYWQAEKVLSSELGSEWRKNFDAFDETPFAAASIGQVHRATFKDGRVVAVKLQYPGVDRSIESDIKNLATLVKVWDILPKGLYIDNLMRVVKRELFWEVDYVREAQCGKLFQKYLSTFPEMAAKLHVPKIIPHLSSKRVITSEFVQGVPIDKLDNDQTIRNQVGEAIIELVFHEVFTFRFMQTDPNFANFIYNPENGKINLLDFGAARSFGKPFIDSYLKVLLAAAQGDRTGVLERSRDIGFLTGYETRSMENAHVDSVMILGETLRSDTYDFGKQSATRKVTSLMPVMAKERLTPPPDESYSLHRKFGGVFLLLAQLGSVVPCRKHFRNIVDNYKFDSVNYTMANMPVDDGNTGLKIA